jgi:hypothetical protein
MGISKFPTYYKVNIKQIDVNEDRQSGAPPTYPPWHDDLLAEVCTLQSIVHIHGHSQASQSPAQP